MCVWVVTIRRNNVLSRRTRTNLLPSEKKIGTFFLSSINVDQFSQVRKIKNRLKPIEGTNEASFDTQVMLSMFPGNKSRRKKWVGSHNNDPKRVTDANNVESSSGFSEILALKPGGKRLN